MTEAETGELVEVCAEAARRGGEVLRAKWGQARTVELKGGIDLVTDADRASEAAVLGFLRGRFPSASVLAEESGASGEGDAGGLHFVVDPLDGTTNYAHGLPHFAVTVAAADAGGILAGATLDPLRGELFTAGRGLGAFLRTDAGGPPGGPSGGPRGGSGAGVPIAPSGRGRLVDSLLVTGFPYDIHAEHGYALRLFGAFVTRARGVRRYGSAALDLAYVACGRFDGFWEQKLKPWDVAAGILLCREAGATVTDLAGGDGMLGSGDILAATPALHAPMQAVIDEAAAPRPG